MALSQGPDFETRETLKMITCAKRTTRKGLHSPGPRVIPDWWLWVGKGVGATNLGAPKDRSESWVPEDM
jgi:hypothetical protein